MERMPLELDRDSDLGTSIRGQLIGTTHEE